MTNTQILKDEHGNPLFAVIPYLDYLGLLKELDEKNQQAPVSNATEIPLPYSKGAFLDVIRFVDFFHRLHQQGINSIPVDARNEVLDSLLERYTTPESQKHPGLDVLIRLYFLPADSPYKNTRQAVKEVVHSLENTGIFTLTRETFPNFYRAVNAIQYDPNAGLAYLQKHGAIDKNGISTVISPIPLNPFSA